MKKKLIVIASLVLALGLIGATAAYFSASGSFTNNFSVAAGSNEIKEVFSPEDAQGLKPGATVNKDVICENTGDIPVYVRVKYTEVGSDALVAAMDMNFANADSWTLSDDGWYYYKAALNKGDSIQHLDSVSLSKDYVATATETYAYIDKDGNQFAISADEYNAYKTSGKLIVGGVEVKDYSQIVVSQSAAGGDYQLKVQVETIQAVSDGWTKTDIAAAGWDTTKF